MSFLSSLFAGSKPGQPAAPAWQSDPLVGQTDNSLFNFGTNVLQGILPTQYQNLMTPNSPQFQTMLNNSNAQIQGSALSTEAMNGNARGGAAEAGATQAIASNTANLSYQDLLNTQINQKALLGTGLQSIQAANTGALTNQGQENSFASSIYGTQMQGYGQNLNYNAQMANLSANVASQIGNGIGSGISNLPFLNSGSPAAGGGGGGLSQYGGILGSLGSSSGVTAATPDLMAMLALA